MTESNEQVKVSPRDIPLVADTIKEGFIEDGWQDAGTYPVKEGINISELAPDVSVIKAIAERMRLNLRNSGRLEKKGAKKMKSSVWCKLLLLIMFCIMSEGSFADKTYGYVAQGGIYYHTECEFTRVGDAVSIQWSRAYVGDCLNKDSESASVSSTIEWSFNLLRTTEGSFPVYVTSRVVGIGPSAVSSSRAFFECTKLKRVTLPDTLSYIGPNSFWRCSELQTIEIPGSVTNIGSGAFSECAALKSIGMPDSMTTISDSTWYECDSLKDVKIGKNVETIGRTAFCRCYAMTEITIPASVTNIAFDAFKGCDGLQRFIVDPANPNYASYDGALYTKDLKTLVCYPGGRTDVKLPPVAVETQEDAFTGCGKLWAEWYRAFQKTRYDLSNTVEDRAITSITVDRDTVLDDFVMTDGKVYDTVLHIVNTSNGAVNLTLPKGYTYETFKGSIPLVIPANSRNVLTITRTADDSFLVAREELEVVK